MVETVDRTDGELYPPATRTFDEPDRPRWSRRRKITSGVAAMVALALIGGGVWWNREVTDNPLEFQPSLNVGRRDLTDRTGIVEVTNALGDETSVDFVRDGRFSAWIILRNEGPRDVRIEAIGPAGFYYWGLEGAVVADDPDDPEESLPEGDRPLRPFTLHEGESRGVRLDFRFADCDLGQNQGGSSTITSLGVKYRTLGFSRTVSVPFYEMAITVMATGHCDKPILDRDVS